MRRGRAGVARTVATGLLLAATATATAATTGAAGVAQAQAPEAAFATFDPVSVSTLETLLSVSFPDPDHGWAVGQNGRILATTDGGATWQVQVSGLEGADRSGASAPVLRGVAFADARHGFAVGSPGLLLATSDGGATWERRDPPPLESIPGGGPGRAGLEGGAQWVFRSVAATGPRSAYVVGEGGAILATDDGGATWSWRGDRRFGQLTSVTFPDPRNGHAVGTYGPAREPFVTLATTDGGATWEERAAPDLAEEVVAADFSAVTFSDPRRGYVVGAGGRILATSDAGRHWAVQRRDTTEFLHGLAVTGTRGVAVGTTHFTDGDKASILTTADGGETWVARLVPGNVLWGADFAGPTTAVVVGCAALDAFAAVQNGQETTLRPCRQSLVAKVTFADRASSSGGGGAGGGGLPVAVLIGSAVVVGGLAAVLLARRRTRREWH
jgi:photosystem II stability/assembly factor-like uncharacterized protein